MKASETAMTRIAAAIPRMGCFSPFTIGSPLLKTNRPRTLHHPRPVCQRFQRGKLLIIVRRAVRVASGEDASVGHRDLSLADSVGIGFLGAYAADLNFVSDFQCVGSPALAI